jgi:L,D-transpeptidase ErfK/SrfK
MRIHYWLMVLFLAMPMRSAQATPAANATTPQTAAGPGKSAQSPQTRALPSTVGENQTVTVKKDQTLLKIALHYGLGAEHVAMANHVDLNAKLHAGQKLLIPGRRILPPDAPADGIVVNIPERMLYLFRHGHFIKYYPVAIGRGTHDTPLGKFKITRLVKNPTWLPPAWAGKGEAVIKPGPGNPLGDRWIGISAKGIGFHATADLNSVGTVASHGCMRMIPEMVNELFHQVYVGMPVRIEYATARLGRDAKSQQICAAAFPDVYHLKSPQTELSRLARADGVTNSLKAAQIERLSRQPSGCALSLKNLTAASSHQTARR